MSEPAYSKDLKDYNNAREELTRIKVLVCMKALQSIGALPIDKAAEVRLEEALYEAFAWI
jgi:hypothetical protein